MEAVGPPWSYPLLTVPSLLVSGPFLCLPCSASRERVPLLGGPLLPALGSSSFPGTEASLSSWSCSRAHSPWFAPLPQSRAHRTNRNPADFPSQVVGPHLRADFFRCFSPSNLLMEAHSYRCLCQHWVTMCESWHLTVHWEPPEIPKSLKSGAPSSKGGCPLAAPGGRGLFWGLDWHAALEIYLWDLQSSPSFRTRGN